MKFCFWGDIGSAIRGQTIGGGELQIALLTRALAMAGHEIVVIDPYIDEPFVTNEGVKVINVPGWNRGIKGLRTFFNRLPALYKLLVRQKADYYYVRMRAYTHLVSYLAAKKAKAKFVVALASDIDLLSIRQKYKSDYKTRFNLYKYLTQWLPNDIAFRFLLKRADFIVRQHVDQKPDEHRIKGKTMIFPNIIDRTVLPVPDNSAHKYFMYSGSLTILKGADKLYEIISQVNGTCSFMVVGQPNDSVSVPIFEKMQKLKNASVKGRLSHNDTMQLLTGAKALINTSRNEGFPNVFLEAWTMGIPVLSLKVNPGNIFGKYNLGKCFDGDISEMKKYIAADKIIDGDKESCISYIKQFHDFNTAARRFTEGLKKAE